MLQTVLYTASNNKNMPKLGGGKALVNRISGWRHPVALSTAVLFHRQDPVTKENPNKGLGGYANLRTNYCFVKQ